MNGIPDHFWEDLLIYIEEGQVIPIVGEELAVLPEGPLHRVVAEHLAEDLKIPPDRWPKDLRLDHVVGLHAPFRERRASLYPRVKTVLDRLRPPVPDPCGNWRESCRSGSTSRRRSIRCWRRR